MESGLGLGGNPRRAAWAICVVVRPGALADLVTCSWTQTARLHFFLHSSDQKRQIRGSIPGGFLFLHHIVFDSILKSNEFHRQFESFTTLLKLG